MRLKNHLILFWFDYFLRCAGFLLSSFLNNNNNGRSVVIYSSSEMRICELYVWKVNNRNINIFIHPTLAYFVASLWKVFCNRFLLFPIRHSKIKQICRHCRVKIWLANLKHGVILVIIAKNRNVFWLYV